MDEDLLSITSPAITSLAAPVVYFPVRHHSPACARIVRRLIESLRPAIVLIEGPSDYNPHLSELLLPHKLPISIYSYVEWEASMPSTEEPSRTIRKRSGAYYPFCIYSPEWQALRTAHRLHIPFRFIDLPWSEMVTLSKADAGEAPSAQRYADGELRHSDYIATLCQRLGVEDFDGLWDTLIEIDPDLTPETYMERTHNLCATIRATDPDVPPLDLHREAYMATCIQEARATLPSDARILVVTGGFHSSALYRMCPADAAPASTRLYQSGPPDSPDLKREETAFLTENRGIALTPYSYTRLDSLTGYEAGMPSPGFYDQVWYVRDRQTTTPTEPSYKTLLGAVVTKLRELKQTVSTADLIAVETMAQGLARFRAHAEVWRTDLIDGVIAALIKDERALGVEHPFLQALYAVFRGGERGQLAKETRLPPLILDIRNLLAVHDLEATLEERILRIDLHETKARERNRILHRLRLLDLPGYVHTGGTDFTARQDLVHLWEEWTLRWSPEFEGSCIEATIYGPTLAEAVANRIGEQVQTADRDSEVMALALLNAAQADVIPSLTPFHTRLIELVRAESDLLRLARALGHLLYLYRYDEAFGSAGDLEVGTLLQEAFERGLWLLEGLGQSAGAETEQLEAIRLLVETAERCPDQISEGRAYLTEVLERVAHSNTSLPIQRGACAGALWTLGAEETAGLLEIMTSLANPAQLGDYLTGLFSLARETAQRQPDLLLHLDGLLSGYDGDDFLYALPALRLAFSYFTPREKHYLALTLMQARQLPEEEREWAPLAPLEVDAQMAAQTMALESRLYATLEKYGIRGKR